MNAAVIGFCTQVLSALGNGLWQGLVLTAAVCGGLKVLRSLNAATRHAVELAALAIIATLPAIHFLIAERGKRAEPPGLSGQTAAGAPAFRFDAPANATATPGNAAGSTANVSASARSAVLPALERDGKRAPDALRPASAPDPRSHLPEAEYVAEDRFRGVLPTAAEPAARWAKQPSAVGAQARDNPEPTRLDKAVFPTTAAPAGSAPGPQFWRLSLPPALSVALVLGWAVLAGGRLTLLAWQYLALLRLKRRSAPAPATVIASCDRLRCELSLRRAVAVRLSGELNSPVAAGFRSPVILLPAALAGEAEAGLDSILRHELAHLGRWDDWTNLLQHLVRATLFFHPAVWWLSRRLTLDREIACDDHVLVATRSAQDYALFLTEFAGRARAARWVPAPAAWSNHSQLKERIRMLLDRNRNSSPRLVRAKAGTLSGVAALLAGLGLYAGPRLAFAQTEASPQPAPASSNAAEPSPAAATVSASNEAPLASPAPKPKPALATTSSVSVSAPVATNVRLALEQPAVATVAPAEIELNPAPPAPPSAPALPGAVTLNALPTPPEPAAPLPPPDDYRAALEKRLARLERQVQALLARQGASAKAASHNGLDSDASGEWKTKDKWEAKPRMIDEARLQAENARAKAEDARRVREASREAERLVREKSVGDKLEAQRAAERVARALQSTGSADAARLDQLQSQRAALAQERAALRKAAAEIESQLDRLEAQLDRVSDQADRLKEAAVQPPDDRAPANPSENNRAAQPPKPKLF